VLYAVDLDDASESSLKIFGIERLARFWRCWGLRPIVYDIIVNETKSGIRLEVVSFLKKGDDFLGRSSRPKRSADF